MLAPKKLDNQPAAVPAAMPSGMGPEVTLVQAGSVKVDSTCTQSTLSGIVSETTASETVQSLSSSEALAVDELDKWLYDIPASKEKDDQAASVSCSSFFIGDGQPSDEARDADSPSEAACHNQPQDADLEFNVLMRVPLDRIRVMLRQINLPVTLDSESHEQTVRRLLEAIRRATP